MLQYIAVRVAVRGEGGEDVCERMCVCVIDNLWDSWPIFFITLHCVAVCCSLLQCVLQCVLQCALQRERSGGVMCACVTQSPCDPWPALVYTSIRVYISNIYLQTTYYRTWDIYVQTAYYRTWDIYLQTTYYRTLDIYVSLADTEGSCADM